MSRGLLRAPAPGGGRVAQLVEPGKPEGARGWTSAGGERAARRGGGEGAPGCLSPAAERGGGQREVGELTVGVCRRVRGWG